MPAGLTCEINCRGVARNYTLNNSSVQRGVPWDAGVDQIHVGWKMQIVFVVTAIQYVEGFALRSDQYDFGLDQPSVYPSDDSTATKI